MKNEFGKKAKAHTRYRLEDGTIVPGTTTVTGVLDKPALRYWANDIGLQGIDMRKYVDAAANVGTLAHYMAECDLRGEKPDLSEYAPTDISKAENALIKFWDYRDEHQLEPILVEGKLVSEEYRYGGQIDFYGKRDGVLAQIDFKTGKPNARTGSGIYPEMMLQVTAYRQLLIENGYPVERVFILRIGRDETEGFEEREVDRTDVRWEMFKHCLGIYYLQEKLGK